MTISWPPKAASQAVSPALFLFAACAPEPPPAMVQDTLPVAHGQLVYDILGQGPLLVLIHGGFGDRRMWDRQIGPLAERYRVVRYDHRGFGESPPPDQAYSPVADLTLLLDSLGAERAHLVGNSMGGSLAIDFALVHPRRVATLTLVAAGPNGFPAPDEDIQDVVEVFRLAHAGEVDAAAERWVQHPMIRVAMHHGTLAPFVRNMVWENRQALALEHWPVEPLDSAAAARLGEIEAPTLVMVGADDIPLVQAAARAAAEGIPGAELIVMEATDHLPQLERPEEFNRRLLRFLEAHGRPSVARPGSGRR